MPKEGMHRNRASMNRKADESCKGRHREGGEAEMKLNVFKQEVLA